MCSNIITIFSDITLCIVYHKKIQFTTTKDSKNSILDEDGKVISINIHTSAPNKAARTLCEPFTNFISLFSIDVCEIKNAFNLLAVIYTIDEFCDCIEISV